ncbi:hypothetical protein GCM10022289_01650 [Pedobacter jeongneungensis]|uniref:Uncharacterized protein n=1 Tax=Pedobacter jeongneungensis TaxID=947309 RepID=A0ABP8B2H8_9SPHI
MSEIKSLADQLKTRLEEQKGLSEKSPGTKAEGKPVRNEPKAKTVAVDPKRLSNFLSSLQEFNMDGQEKILIRIDKRTMSKLRQLKTASNIDMSRVIVFSLDRFLKSHPWLNEYISQTLKNMTHELD